MTIGTRLMGSRVFIGLGLLCVCVAVWQVVTAVGGVNSFLVPSPAAVALVLVSVLTTGTTYSALGTTIVEIVAALVLAGGFALAIGIPVGWHRLTQHAYEPLLANLAAIPLVILYPVFAVIFGIGPLSKVAFGAATAFFPVVLAVVSGVAATNQSLIVSARSMGARGLTLLLITAIPSALPVIVSGLRLGLTLATLAVVGGEFIAGTQGLGYLLASAGEAFETKKVYAYVVLTLLLAIGLNVAFGLLVWLSRKVEER
ncbi:MAG TPA: ABC transporter permease subunit [Candidatus Dormibacteraeota bacterium]|nr:ABC transporter permease subunit [Candidatus Dormibacteraeota bacterium]